MCVNIKTTTARRLRVEAVVTLLNGPKTIEIEVSEKDALALYGLLQDIEYSWKSIPITAIRTVLDECGDLDDTAVVAKLAMACSEIEDWLSAYNTSDGSTTKKVDSVKNALDKFVLPKE
jgi:hypothetical protein